MPKRPQKVDVNVPRFNQTLVALLAALAFVIQQPILIGLLAVILAASVWGGPRWSLFSKIYLKVVKPRLGTSHPVELEDAAPPRFAQTLGAVFLGASYLLLFAGQTSVGWAIALLVVALATLAATARICVGCIVYLKVVAR